MEVCEDQYDDARGVIVVSGPAAVARELGSSVAQGPASVEHAGRAGKGGNALYCGEAGEVPTADSRAGRRVLMEFDYPEVSSAGNCCGKREWGVQVKVFKSSQLERQRCKFCGKWTEACSIVCTVGKEQWRVRGTTRKSFVCGACILE